ncbi:hypothetical protein ES702_02003 [subsurface metagenome]
MVNTLTSSEVRKILKISKPTLYKLLAKGDLHGIKVGRDWRIPEENLEEFLDHRKK